MTAVIPTDKTLMSGYDVFDTLPFTGAFSGNEDVPTAPVVWLFGNAVGLHLIDDKQGSDCLSGMVSWCGAKSNANAVRNDFFLLGHYLYNGFT